MYFEIGNKVGVYAHGVCFFIARLTNIGRGVCSARARAEREKYNRRNSTTPMTHLLIFIDEYAALLSGSDFKLEKGRGAMEALVIEISQRCRKTGIHLIVASQSARVDTFNVNLRDNLATKVALKCVSEGGSTVAFGYKCDDAIKLAGNGDMWVIGHGAPRRAQGFYIDDEAIGPNGKTKLQQLIDLAKKVQA